MALYTVYQLEIAHKIKNRYKVYHEISSGAINLSDNPSDEEIISVLTEAKYFDFSPFDEEEIEVDSDGDQLFINYEKEPYLQLKKFSSRR